MDNNLNKSDQLKFDVISKNDIKNHKSKNSFRNTNYDDFILMTEDVLKLIPSSKLIKSNLKYPLLDVKKIN